jgi:hypothetical protein
MYLESSAWLAMLTAAVSDVKHVCDYVIACFHVLAFMQFLYIR